MIRKLHTAAGGTHRAPLFQWGLAVLVVGAGLGFGTQLLGKITPAHSTEHVVSARFVKDRNSSIRNVSNIAPTPANEPVHEGRVTANGGFVVPSWMTVVQLENPGRYVGYVMAKYSLVARTEDAQCELVANGERVRDLVSGLIQRKGYEGLRKPGMLSKEALKGEMKAAINEAFDQPLVERVYIPEFVIQ
ncbi:hypothetical protein GC207_01420 [bacterium]|nr:hypothetical protein [bacterium]